MLISPPLQLVKSIYMQSKNLYWKDHSGPGTFRIFKYHNSLFWLNFSFLLAWRARWHFRRVKSYLASIVKLRIRNLDASFRTLSYLINRYLRSSLKPLLLSGVLLLWIRRAKWNNNSLVYSQWGFYASIAEMNEGEYLSNKMTKNKIKSYNSFKATVR
jgi:hypothetical protein